MVEVINHMYMEGEVSDVQKQEIIVCVRKKMHPIGVEDYRTLTLLNTDYRLLTRVIAQRLGPWMGDLLYANQYCGKRGQTIFDAVAAVRYIIAYAEVTKMPMCVLTVDFKEAFDRIYHEYLFGALKASGFSEHFMNKLKRIYENATSTLHMNGYRSRKIRIDNSVRQGCPCNGDDTIWIRS
jgi:hypothetical protein